MNKDKETLEAEFINRIDCNFPCQNLDASSKLIEEAKSISSNSVFTLIEELARIPVSERRNVTEIELKILLSKATEKLDHPLKEQVVEIAQLMIEQKQQSVEQALILMEKIEKFPGQWGALSLAYFSCDDVGGKVDQKFEQIRDNWNNTYTRLKNHSCS